MISYGRRPAVRKGSPPSASATSPASSAGSSAYRPPIALSVPVPTVTSIARARRLARWSGVSIALQSYDEGVPVPEIARLIGRSVRTVYQMIGVYNSMKRRYGKASPIRRANDPPRGT
jgi:hypothetical protein